MTDHPGANQTTFPTDDDLRNAVRVVQAYMRREFIVSDCRKAPCFGCASCEAIALERRLDALLAII